MSQALQEVDLLPAPLEPCFPVVDHSEPVPTDDEARKALQSINATTSVDALRAMQLIGCWSAQLKVPQIIATRTFTSLDEVDRAKQHAATLINEASGKGDLGCAFDGELLVHAIKSMTTVLLVEERMSRLLMEAHSRSQPEKKAVTSRNKLRPVNHFHIHKAEQPA